MITREYTVSVTTHVTAHSHVKTWLISMQTGPLEMQSQTGKPN